MRGITFTIEAAAAVVVIIAIASYFIFPLNQPNNFAAYKTIALDISNLAASTNYWGEPLYQQQTANKWGSLSGLCVKLTKEKEAPIQSDNCGEISKTHVITAERVYFDQSTGQMSAFIVGISPPG